MNSIKRPLQDKTNSPLELNDNGPSPKKRLCTTNNRMRVYVRVRPVDASIHDSKRTIDVIDDTMLVFDPVDPIESDENYVYHGVKYKEIGKRAHKNLKFNFDKVFAAKSSNMDVYEATTKQFVPLLLDGFNCTVFAYGATGSGKTHTMLGSEDDPGVIYFTTLELFKAIQSKSPPLMSPSISPKSSPGENVSSSKDEIDISVSYFQIYNETVYDLLEPTGKALNVLHDAKGDITVHGLSTHHPTDAHHLIKMLEYGNENRSKQATDANHQSSRSHAIFQLSIKKQTSSSSQMCIQTSKMTLIDLAGSERASVAYKTNRSKVLSLEGGNINKSLLALGNCINALTTGGNKKSSSASKFIPYRSSKLTLLLKDSLGGNCQTAMIATINPFISSYDDTHNTLAYANRAMGIQLNLKRQSIAYGLQPRNYSQALDTLENQNHELRDEITKLKKELDTLKKKALTIDDNQDNVIKSQVNSVELLNSKISTLNELFNERMMLRKKLLKNESQIKKIDLKVMLRRLETRRVGCYKETLDDNSSDETVKRDQLQALFNQKMHYVDIKDELTIKTNENEEKIKTIENALRSRVDKDDYIIDTYFKYQHMLTNKNDMNILNKHVEELVNSELIARIEQSENLVIDSVKLLVYSEKLLSGLNRLSDQLSEQFQQFKRNVENKKNVIWRDNVPKNKQSEFIDNYNFKDILKLSVYELNKQQNINNDGEEQKDDKDNEKEEILESPESKNEVSMKLLTSICLVTPPTPVQTINTNNNNKLQSKLTMAVKPQQTIRKQTSSDSLNETFTLETNSSNNNNHNMNTNLHSNYRSNYHHQEWYPNSANRNSVNNNNNNNTNRNRYTSRNQMRNRNHVPWRSNNHTENGHIINNRYTPVHRNPLTSGLNNHNNLHNAQSSNTNLIPQRFRF